MARVAHAAPFNWSVHASSVVARVAWIACTWILPSQSGTGCIRAALLVGINAVIHAHGGTGTSDAAIPTKRAIDAVSFCPRYS
ncbi:hypothetical protein VI817_005541 [Penicillium citrinum]|nr:hypothetical protein VI817_005541 [Penicillium citrinum]